MNKPEKIITEFNNYINQQTFEFVSEDDWFRMDFIRKKDSNLPMTIYPSVWLDGRKNNPILRVQGDYTDSLDTKTIFSITIEDEPKVNGYSGNIKEKDIKTIKEFIVENKELLLDYWYIKSNLDSSSIIKIICKRMMNESYRIGDKIFEMSNVLSSETNLKMNIFISTKYENHGPRIKVQNNYSTNMQPGNLFVMTIEDEPEVVTLNIGKLKQKDINSVKLFIKQMKDILLDLWEENNMDIDKAKIEIKKRLEEISKKEKL